MFNSFTIRARRARLAAAMLGAAASFVVPAVAAAEIKADYHYYSAPVSVSEGHSGYQDVFVQARITCKPSDPKVQFCRFSASTRGDTAGTDDFLGLGTSGQSILPGETKDVALGGARIWGDSTYEQDERLWVQAVAEGMAGGVNIEPGVGGSTSLTIVNDDPMPYRRSSWMYG